MAVAVQHGVNARGVAEHVRIGIRDRHGIVAQVSQQNHVIRAFRPGVVHRALHRFIQVGAIVALHEAVDEVAALILEVARGGSIQRLRRGDAHEGQLHAVKFLYDIGGKTPAGPRG